MIAELRQGISVEIDAQVDISEIFLVDQEESRRFDLSELAAGGVARLERTQQAFGQMLFRIGFEGGGHGARNFGIPDYITDGAAVRTLAFGVDRFDPVTMKKCGRTGVVDHGQLPPTNGRVSPR